MKPKKSKQAKQLPVKSALTDLQRPETTIMDYAKASPIKANEQQPTIIQTIRRPQ